MKPDVFCLPAFMRATLLDIHNLVEASTISGRDRDGVLAVGGRWVLPVLAATPADVPPSMRLVDVEATRRVEAEAVADEWVAMVTRDRNLVVSVFFALPSQGSPAVVRFDHPGSMNPCQFADLAFTAAKPDQWLRSHAKRVLRVRL